MKTINLTDDQFDTLFELVNQKVQSIVDASVDYQDSEILEDWEDLFDVHTVLETVDNWSQQPLKCNPSGQIYYEEYTPRTPRRFYFIRRLNCIGLVYLDR